MGRRLPVMIRQALFSSASTFFAWQDFDQTGEQYSAVEKQSARAVDLIVLGFAPQLEFASLLRRLFLVATFALTFLACSLNERVRSSVTPRYTGYLSFSRRLFI